MAFSYIAVPEPMRYTPTKEESISS